MPPDSSRVTPEVEIRRLNDKLPIISSDMFADSEEAENINGPCLIRVPSWLKDDEKAHPSAKYYLYFAHHLGKFIRMAWAAEIEGPWHLYNMKSPYNRGVLYKGSHEEIRSVNKTTIVSRWAHVASPHVLVDDNKQRLVLFFHSSTKNYPYMMYHHSQNTLVTTSRTGLNFNGGPNVKGGLPGESGTDATGEPFGWKPKAIGSSYFHVFTAHHQYYAFANRGQLFSGPSIDQEPWSQEWEPLANPIAQNMADNYAKVGKVTPRYEAGHQDARHFAVRYENDGATLELYYTSRGEKPERIFRTLLNTTTWETATTGTPDVHDEVLRPEEEWEGASLNLTISKNGATGDENALRDPFLFTDVDGQTYLLYSGMGEHGIGLAILNNLPTANIEFMNEFNGSATTLVYSAQDTDGTIASMTWNWGDGTSDEVPFSNEESQEFGYIEHDYPQESRYYNVTLIVTDNVGGSYRVWKSIQSSPVPTKEDKIPRNTTSFSLRSSSGPRVTRKDSNILLFSHVVLVLMVTLFLRVRKSSRMGLLKQG